MKIPKIDFKYWYQYSLDLNKKRDKDNKPKILRHHDVINMIYTKRYLSENIKTAYFTNYVSKKEIKIEVSKLLNFTYYELENYIIECIDEARKNKFYIDKLNGDIQMLKIFDLIQIWGGIPGGGGPYQIRKKNGQIMPWRSSNNLVWIKDYKEAALKASNGDVQAYSEFRKIKHLGGLAFASKHAYFFSKHLNDKSLIIIDVKIAHCFGYNLADSLEMSQIKILLKEVSNAAKSYKLTRWQIEKALFTFHLVNFKGGKVITKTLKSKDLKIINDLSKWYSSLNLKTSIVSHKSKQYKYKKRDTGKTSVFKLTTKDNVHYTYRKYISDIKSLKSVLYSSYKQQQNWAQKWFDVNNKIEILKTFENLEEAIKYQNSIKNNKLIIKNKGVKIKT